MLCLRQRFGVTGLRERSLPGGRLGPHPGVATCPALRSLAHTGLHAGMGPSRGGSE